MPPGAINLGKLLLAGSVAGGWVLLSGIVMAAVFGYRDMKAAGVISTFSSIRSARAPWSLPWRQPR